MEPNPTDPTSYITGSTLQDINNPIGPKIPGKETKTVGFRCNLDGRVDSYLRWAFSERRHDQRNGRGKQVLDSQRIRPPVNTAGATNLINLGFDNHRDGTVDATLSAASQVWTPQRDVQSFPLRRRDL
jgi:flagellar hook protein FlgE